jgi:Uma2 family endonuclease
MPTQQFVESGRQMTLDEWANLDEDAPGELVDGRLVEDEEVGFLHDLVVGWVIHALRSWVVPRGGLVAASDSRFAVSATSGRKPDVSVYFAGRRPPATGLITVAPDIMIEVVSPRPPRRPARPDRENGRVRRVRSRVLLDCRSHRPDPRDLRARR